MIESLYEPFKHWSEMSGVFILSDTHFNDSDCKLMDKNWISVDEQVDRINKLVHKNDTLIILGDVGDTRYISRLKAGYKVLVMGNHDSGASNYKRAITELTIKNCTLSKRDVVEQLKKNPEYENSQIHISDKPDRALLVEIDNKLFDEVYEGPLCISEKIILSHEPINLPYFVNIHGHDHAGKFRDGKNLNVAANVCNYTPINLKNEIKNGLLANVLSIHRMTIDNASRNPLHKRGNKT